MREGQARFHWRKAREGYRFPRARGNIAHPVGVADIKSAIRSADRLRKMDDHNQSVSKVLQGGKIVAPSGLSALTSQFRLTFTAEGQLAAYPDPWEDPKSRSLKGVPIKYPLVARVPNWGIYLFGCSRGSAYEDSDACHSRRP